MNADAAFNLEALPLHRRPSEREQGAPSPSAYRQHRCAYRGELVLEKYEQRAQSRRA